MEPCENEKCDKWCIDKTDVYANKCCEFTTDDLPSVCRFFLTTKKESLAENQVTCKWQIDESQSLPDDRYFLTGCKSVFYFIYDGTLEKNNFQHCPYCGGKIKLNKENKTAAAALCKYGCENIETDSCPEESPDGFPCTRPEGHEGCHVSCGMHEHGTVKWRQKPKG